MIQSTGFLKSEFQDLLKNDAGISSWLVEDVLHGIWYCDLSMPGVFWINDAFWKSLGYKKPVEGNEFDFWSMIIATIDKDRTINIIAESTKNKKGFKSDFIYKTESGKDLILCGEGRVIYNNLGEAQRLLIKYKKEGDTGGAELVNKLRELEDLQEIYDETNEVAKVGGWDVNLITQKITWTKITRIIHEVADDFIPEIENAIAFYKEGHDRDLISQLFADALEKGLPYSAELQMTTAKGREIWIRTFGKPEMKDGECVRVYGAIQDITAEKEKELEYLKVKSRFKKIFETSPIGIMLVNKQGKLLMANPASLSILGFNGTDESYVIDNLTYKELVHPDDVDIARKYRKRLLDGEISNYKLEVRSKKKNGDVIWCATNTSIMKGGAESEDLIITQFEDITVRKGLEEVAVENAKRFQTAFESSPNGMALVGTDGKWLMVNDMLSQMIGYTKEEFVKLTFQEITYKEDLDLDLRLLKETLDNKRTTYSIEKRYIHKDGSLVYGLLNVSLIRDNDGEPLYFISQINNITKRVKAQQELQKALNEHEGLLQATTQAAIIMADTNGIVIKYNKGAENLLGYKPEDVIGKFHVKGFHLEEEVQKRKEVLSKKYGRPIEGFEIFIHKVQDKWHDSREWTFVRKNGTLLQVQLIITPVTNHLDEIVGYLGIATDISELKAMESSLIAAREKAEAANKSKSEFLANMSHEIRTPLNGVIGFTDLLMKTELSDVQMKYMDMVNTSAHSLLDLINDILDFSKIEAGKLELHEEKTDLVELCSNTMDIIKHNAHSKGLEVLVNIPPQFKRFVYADTIRLRQVLINLLGNAVKFTEKGEVALEVKNKPSGTDEMEYTFIIRDTGIGIAPENIEKIFNAFDQEDASTTRKYGGTGLGITISSRLLALMGTSLQVQSELGKGSVFSFKVKFKTQDEVVYPQKISNVKNVLIVDDNANNRLILKDMLAYGQVKSELVSGAGEAISILEKNKSFDLVIVDYNMPDLDGVELIAHIRNALKLSKEDLPIMLLHSSVDDDKIIQACKDYDIHFNLTKPIIIDQLFDLIDNIQSGKAYKKDNIVLADSAEFETVFNILVAEDNPVNKFLAKTIIQKILPKSKIFLAEDGLEAVKMFKSMSIDFVFMDLQMPNMSGFEATRKIREIEQDNHVPIIALTARALKGEKEQCLEAGMDNYVTKPVVYETIREIIKTYLIEPKSEERDAKSYTLEYLEMISENNEKFILETLLLFKTSVKQKLEELDDAVVAGERKTAGEIAHNIKPSFEMLGSEVGRELCDKLCYTATDEEVPSLANRLKMEYLKIVKELTEDYPVLKE